MSRIGASGVGYLVAGVGFGLAAGVGLGVFVLGPNLPAADSPESESAVLEPQEAAEAAEEKQRARAEVSNQAVGALLPDALAGTLSGHPVLLLGTAAAAEEDVLAVRWLLGQAEALDSGLITLSEGFFAEDQAEALTTLITDTLPEGVELSAEVTSPGTRVGEALGAALLLDPMTVEPQTSSADRAVILQSLRDAGFLSYEDGTILPAQVIVLLTGEEDGTADAAFASHNLAAFAVALDERGFGTVVAGRGAAAGEQGPVGVVRAQDSLAEQITTVDSLDLEASRGATVLGVWEQLAGQAGAYGPDSPGQAAFPELPA